jgi:hypothetical protein
MKRQRKLGPNSRRSVLGSIAFADATGSERRTWARRRIGFSGARKLLEEFEARVFEFQERGGIAGIPARHRLRRPRVLSNIKVA